MSLLWVGFLAIGALALIVIFILAMRRWPTVGVSLLSVTVLVAWELPHPPALLGVAGVSVYLIDVVCVGMIAIALKEWRAIHLGLGPIALAWSGLGLLLLASLASGLMQNGVGTAFNEFRSFLYPYAATSWVFCQSRRSFLSDDSLARFSLLIGWSLVIVACYHVSIYGLGDTSEFVETMTGLEQTTRPLVSGQAFMLLAAAIVVVRAPATSSRLLHGLSSVTFLLVTLLTQQRTVWVVGIVCLLYVFIIARSALRLSIIVSSIITVWIGSIALAAAISLGSFSGIRGSSTNTGTYDARVRSWAALIEGSVESGPVTVLFGAPMGSGFGRFEGAGRWVEFSPHNWYLTIYLRSGVIGLICVLLVFLFLLAKLSRLRNTPAPAAIIVAIIVYGWSYSWLWYFCVFIGWAAAKVIDNESDAAESEVYKWKRENGLLRTEQKRQITNRYRVEQP